MLCHIVPPLSRDVPVRSSVFPVRAHPSMKQMSFRCSLRLWFDEALDLSRGDVQTFGVCVAAGDGIPSSAMYTVLSLLPLSVGAGPVCAWSDCEALMSAFTETKAG